MMGQTLLIRNADGDYSPAHRSFIEFFVAYKFAAELGILADDFAALAREKNSEHIDNSLRGANYAWTEYFRPVSGRQPPTAPLKSFVTESLSNLIQSVGYQPLSKAVLDLMLNMIGPNNSEASEQLVSIICSIRSTSMTNSNFLGGNLGTIAARVDSRALRARDFSSINLSGLSLGAADISRTNLSNCDLTKSQFTQIIATRTNFSGSDITGADFSVTQLDSCSIDPINGDIIVSGYNRVLRFDRTTGALVAAIRPSGAWHSWSIRYLPNGSLLMIGGWGGFGLRDARTLKLLSWHELSQVRPHKRVPEKGRNLWCNEMAVTNDSTLAFIGNNNGAIYAWNLVDNREIGSYVQHTSHVLSTTIDAAGTSLVTSSSRELIVWSITPRGELKMQKSKDGQFVDAAVHPTKPFIVSLSRNKLTCRDKFSLVRHRAHEFKLGDRIAFSADGAYLYVLGKEELVVYESDLSTEHRRISLTWLGRGEVFHSGSLCADPLGRNVLVTSTCGVALLIDVARGFVVDEYINLHGKFKGASFVDVTGLDENIAAQMAKRGAHL